VDVFVAKAAELSDGDRKVVRYGHEEIGVFRWDGALYAYSNFCLHQGGPACQGLVMHEMEQVVDDAEKWCQLQLSADLITFVCPWHGWEYDLKTGEFVGNRKLKLRRYPVRESQGDVFVAVE